MDRRNYDNFIIKEISKCQCIVLRRALYLYTKNFDLYVQLGITDHSFIMIVQNDWLWKISIFIRKKINV